MAKFPKVESLQRQNLLINSDFKSGIINQKGLQTYSGQIGSKVYTIDMWYTSGINVAVNQGYLRLVNRQTSECGFAQYINTNETNDYTITVYVSTIVSGNVKVALYDENENEITRSQNLQLGLNTLNVNSKKISKVGLLCAANCDLNLWFVKLEKGSCYTGMPAWNYTLELLKCQRYLLVVKPLFGNSTYFKSQSGPRASMVVIQVPTPVQMNKKPVVAGTVLAKYRCYSDKEYWITVTNPEVDSISSTHLNIIFNQEGLSRNVTGEIWIESPLVLDAYDY